MSEEYNRVVELVGDFLKNTGGYILNKEDAKHERKYFYYQVKFEGSFIWAVMLETDGEIYVYKYGKLNETKPFSKLELKFLDINNIRLHPEHIEETGQEVEDWF